MDSPDWQSMAEPANLFRALELGLLALQRLDESRGFPVALRAGVPTTKCSRKRFWVLTSSRLRRRIFMRHIKGLLAYLCQFLNY